MDASGESEELKQHHVENSAGFRITTRRVVWENVLLPVALITIAVALVYGFSRIPWNDIWNGSLDEAQFGPITLQIWASLLLFFTLVYYFLQNGSWSLSQTCRYQVAFGPVQRLKCSDPELLNALSPTEFLDAQLLPCSASSLYTFRSASGLLIVRATFADLIEWANRRFGADSVGAALDQTGVPAQWQTARQTFFISWFLFFANAFVAFYVFGSFFVALITGDPGPYPRLDAFDALAAFVLATGYLLLIPCRFAALTNGSLRLKSCLGKRTIPLDSMEEVRAWAGGFTVIFAKGGRKRRVHIAQYMFSESLLPLYFSLRGNLAADGGLKDNAAQSD